MFTAYEIERLFAAKSKDINSNVKQNSFIRFQNYCAQKCVGSKVNLSNMMIRTNATIELSNIVKVNTRIA